MHGDDAMRDSLQQLNRVLTRQVGVGRIIVHTEVRMVHRIDDFAEDIHLLGEFRIVPEVVLVMIFDDQGDATFLCVGQTGVN